MNNSSNLSQRVDETNEVSRIKIFHNEEINEVPRRENFHIEELKSLF